MKWLARDMHDLTAMGCLQDWYIKLNDEDTVVVCTMIATAEYCMEVVGALGRSVAKTIDPPFGNKVGLAACCSFYLYY